jgi:hypothetical protein
MFLPETSTVTVRSGGPRGRLGQEWASGVRLAGVKPEQNEALAHDVLRSGGSPRDVVMSMHDWLASELGTMSRVIRATDTNGKDRFLCIRDGKLIELRAHATGVDTIGFGEVRGLRITVSREFDPQRREHRETRYSLGHQSVGPFEIDVRYMGNDERSAILNDLEPFTRGTND